MPAIVCNCSSIGQNGRLLIETTGTGPRTFTGTSTRVEFLYETLGTKRNLQHTDSITGTTSRLITGVRPKSYLTQGVIALQASPSNLHLMLPFILGGTAGAVGSGLGIDVDADGNDRNYPLESILPTFDAMVYRESGIFQYTDLQVAQAILRGKTANGGEANDFMELLLVVIGQQEIITRFGDPSPWPAVEPALPITVDYLPYAFWESDFYLNNVKMPFEEFKLTVDNMLSIKFYDELFPTCIRSTGRKISMEGDLPFTCAALEETLDLYNAQGTAEFRMATPPTTPTFHSSFRLPFARAEWQTPTIRNKADLPFKVMVEGYASAGLDEMVTTNDNVI